MRSRYRTGQLMMEGVFLFALLTQLQWFFGNVYEEILTPNSIVASIAEVDAYNRFFRVTEPYCYYLPLTQLGVLSVLGLAAWRKTPQAARAWMRKAATFGVLGLILTGYIVTRYNMKMFFGDVDSLGDRVHQRYIEWALWNLVRIALVGTEAGFIFAAYRKFLVDYGGRGA